MVELNAIDLFAGPGGWDLAAASIGFEPVGVEWDDVACATRKAAGLRTIQADVADLDVLATGSDVGGAYGAAIDLLIASPPCPTYSSAGKGAGRRLTDVVVRCMHELAVGNDSRAERIQEAYEILEPLAHLPKDISKWPKARNPRKRRQGDAWDGNKYRLARRDLVRERRDREAVMSLLVVEPLRWVLALEPRFIALEQVPEVLPIWSEMAAILGVLGYGTWVGGLSSETFGVPQTRKRAILMAERGAVHVSPPKPTHQRYVKRKPKESGEPSLFDAPVADRYVWPEDRDLLPWVSMAEALSGLAKGRDVWTVSTHTNTRKSEGGDRYRPDGAEFDPKNRPSLTVDSTVGQWTYSRPATTVNGDPRISKPGRHDPEESGSQQKDAIRVTQEEALVLQSFPPDYPVQGTKSQRYLQVGNAVPPLLAKAILTHLLRPVLDLEPTTSSVGEA